MGGRDDARARVGGDHRSTDTGEHELKGKARARYGCGRPASSSADVGGGQRVDGLEAPLTGRDSDLRAGAGAVPRHPGVRPPAARGRRRRGRGREVAAGLGVREVRRRAGDPHPVAPGHDACPTATASRSGRWPRRSGPGSGWSRRTPETVVTEHLDAGLASTSPRAGEREWLRPRLAVLLGVGAGASFAREDLFAAWTAFLEHLAEETSPSCSSSTTRSTPTTGCSTSSTTCSATARSPIFVLALARPDLLAPAPDLGGRRTSVVRLEPLDDDGHGRPGRRARRRPAGSVPVGAGGPGRGHPAVRRRDGARPDRPRPRDPTGGPLRRRRTARTSTSTRWGRPRRCRPWSLLASMR